MHPIAFEPFGFTITSFGVMLALAFLGGWIYTGRLTRKTGWFSEEVIGDLLFWLMVGGVVGARLLYVVVHWETFRADASQIFNFRAGGLVSYGGFVGAFLAGWIFTRRHKLDFVQLADLCVPGALLGQAIGRIGCFLVADDYGRPAPDLPWAVRFPDVEGSMLPQMLREQPLHPTQLYLCLKAFLCFLIVRWVFHHRRFRGQVMCTAMMVYPIGRSIVEIWRYDSVERGVYAGLSTAQWISIPLFLAGAFLWFRFKNRSATS
jgi:phosphatidylglycerol:prolipoprotein diacylglycerol transferase